MRIEIERHCDQRIEMMQVLAVNDEIEGEWQPGVAHKPGDLELAGMASRESADTIAALFIAILDAELDMIEAGGDERIEALGIQQNTRCDEIGIKPGAMGLADKIGQIAACGRLAAGEMDLQHAEGSRFGDNPTPLFRRQLVARALEL
jgi:hypothetical protein